VILDAIGAVGSSMLAICGLPQAVKSWREGHSDGVSAGMLALWGGGEALLLVYVAASYADVMLITNYTINLAVIGVIVWYRLRPRR
jgi:uncharacterized protein with PQ loop repeat